MATCCRGAHDILPKSLPLYYNELLQKLLRDKITYRRALSSYNLIHFLTPLVELVHKCVLCVYTVGTLV